MFLVGFYWVGDNNFNSDSVWDSEVQAKARAEFLDDIGGISSADWEPIAHNKVGYSIEELEDL